jgi:hypothetical protein
LPVSPKYKIRWWLPGVIVDDHRLTPTDSATSIVV